MLQGVSAETQISVIIISVKELKRHFNQKMLLVLTLTVQIVLFKADSATKGMSIKVRTPINTTVQFAESKSCVLPANPEGAATPSPTGLAQDR